MFACVHEAPLFLPACCSCFRSMFVLLFVWPRGSSFYPVLMQHLFLIVFPRCMSADPGCRRLVRPTSSNCPHSVYSSRSRMLAVMLHLRSCCSRFLPVDCARRLLFSSRVLAPERRALPRWVVWFTVNIRWEEGLCWVVQRKMGVRQWAALLQQVVTSRCALTLVSWVGGSRGQRCTRVGTSTLNTPTGFLPCTDKRGSGVHTVIPPPPYILLGLSQLRWGLHCIVCRITLLL